MSTSDSLRRLVEETCQYPSGSPERRRSLTRLVIAIQRSGKLWKEDTPYYEEALQQTWLYLCRNLCEATTTQEPYNPDRSSVITWLDNYLKWRLRELSGKYGKPQPSSIDDPNMREPVAKPEPPPILEDVEEWVKLDADGDLRGTHVKGHPNANCQILILRRLPPRTPWKEISAELNLPIATLSCFYQRKCMPRLRKFGEERGYL
ncbi:MAG: sigma-70 family RNA polymerase sigma factor [Cyanobacteriota bacterium]|nr:sigma-70 family RNA polymerase sigma factor [Cyanobacteriota bacterium]